MKKLLAVVLAVLLLVSLLSACSLLGGLKLEEIQGRWVTKVDDTQAEAMALLERIDAYEEEIALADIDSLQYGKAVVFNGDKTYSFEYDIDLTKECVSEFYDAYFKALFAGRDTLEEVYGEAFSDMSEEEFLQYYAEIYSCNDYEDLLYYLTKNAYDYEALEEPMETGKFTLDDDDILCTIDGEYSAEAMGAKVDGYTLTLTYIDAVEVYTKD